MTHFLQTPDPWTIMPQVCFLCAHELTPHEAETRREGQSFGMCSACAKQARRVGKSKIHLITEGIFAGMYSKHDFMTSLKASVMVVLRDENDKTIKIYDAAPEGGHPQGQAEELDEYITTSGIDMSAHHLRDEPGFQWPLGTTVEIWNRYRYEGTFVVGGGLGDNLFLEQIQADPVGTSAHIHNDFPESEPKYRYRRLLDPNWQMKLPSRIAEWRKVGRVGEQGYSIGEQIQGMAISAEVYAFHRREYA